ncbi:hypothetical protein GCM10010924_52580 [Rhizobium wenxiniae]|nr:hypothetical protein GCM10010924_52580 [Rhizobium wenxiniae]
MTGAAKAAFECNVGGGHFRIPQEIGGVLNPLCDKIGVRRLTRRLLEGSEEVSFT